jgi:hypothetical protein
MKLLTISFLLLLTLISSCSSATPSSGDGVKVYTGRVTGYTQGNAEIISVSNDGLSRLGEGTIKPNGDFEFAYVETPPATALYGVAEETFFCAELLPTATSTRLLFDNVFDVFVPGNDLSVGFVIAASSREAYTNARKAGDSMLYRVYVNSDLMIKGTCNDGRILNYDFNRGWNVAVRSFVDNGVGGLREEGTTATQIPATNWFYQDYPAQ